jgi:hypothetical protein
MLHNDMYVKFKIDKDLFSEFKVNKCLRQEEVIVLLLLNIVLEIAITRSKVETRINMFDKCRQIVACLDDVLLWEEGVFTSLVENTNKMGLQINKK